MELVDENGNVLKRPATDDEDEPSTFWTDDDGEVEEEEEGFVTWYGGLFSTSANSATILSFLLLPPLYLQFSPVRQALTMIFKENPPCQSRNRSSDSSDRIDAGCLFRYLHNQGTGFIKPSPDFAFFAVKFSIINNGTTLSGDHPRKSIQILYRAVCRSFLHAESSSDSGKQ